MHMPQLNKISKYISNNILTVPSTFHIDNSQKKVNDKKLLKNKKKSHTNIDKTIKTTTKVYKFALKKTKTYDFSHINILKQERIIKEEEDENNLKSRTILLDKNNTLKKLKAILETINEDSSELSISNDDNKNKKNDNNG